MSVSAVPVLAVLLAPAVPRHAAQNGPAPGQGGRARGAGDLLVARLCHPQPAQGETPEKMAPGGSCWWWMFSVVSQITERHFYVSSQHYNLKCSQVYCNKRNGFDAEVNKINLSTVQCNHPGVGFSGLFSGSFCSLATWR